MFWIYNHLHTFEKVRRVFLLTGKTQKFSHQFIVSRTLVTLHYAPLPFPTFSLATLPLTAWGRVGAGSVLVHFASLITLLAFTFTILTPIGPPTIYITRLQITNHCFLS